MMLLYSLLYSVALVLLFPSEYLKRPRELRARWLAEKLGRLGPERRDDAPLVWIHAVSVGEVLAAVPLIRKLTETGAASVVLSTITDTGSQVASEKVPEGVRVIYLPFDLRFALRRALETLNPAAFMTMETELWPNLFGAMREAGVPSFIFNGRISDRSFHRYRKVRFFLEKVFSPVRAAGMQTPRDAARIAGIGMPRERVHVIGNFKFDIQGTLTPPSWVSRLRGPTIVAGSTHEGEERLIVDAYGALRKEHPSLNLVLAPRHPRRLAEVRRLLRDAGHPFLNRSDIPPEGGAEGRAPGEPIGGMIVLVDVLGELAGIYSCALICIVGGSFVPVGGHNIFEAAYWAKPIVCGPHMHNFPLAEEFVRRDALRIAKSEDLCDILSHMLGSPEALQKMGANARLVFTENAGAVDRAIGLLGPYLERRNG